MTLTKPKAIFFDWDGTLVDSYAFLCDAHNHTRAQFGLPPFSLEEFGQYFGQPREKLYTEIYGAENVETAKGHFEGFVYDNHVTGLKPMDGAKELLDGVRAIGVPCGVVTNKKRDLVEAEIQHYGWDEYFISIVGAGEAEQDKPSAAPLELAIERAGLSALDRGDIWLVGDTDNDVRCAIDAGAVSVLVLPEAEAVDILEKFKVGLQCNNCSELADFLLQYAPKPLKG